MFSHSAIPQEYEQEINEQIETTAQRIQKERKSPPENYPSPAVQRVRNLLNTALQDEPTGEIAKTLLAHLSRPARTVPTGQLSRVDFALSTFEIARHLGLQPVKIAEDIASKLHDPLLHVEQVGPYVNVQFDDKLLIEELKGIVNNPESYGLENKQVGKVAIVDYSSPNIAKPFGVNHLRSTVVGEAVARLLEAVGYSVVRDNHLGDWGTQFGNLLAAYKLFGGDMPFESLKLDDLNKLYVTFSNEKKQDIGLARLGQEEFIKLEQGDEVSIKRWRLASKISLEEFERIYKKLHIHFDTMIGEAYFVQRAPILVEEVKKKVPELVKTDDSTDAVYIAAEYPIILRTNDGYCVYAARDLATIEQRMKDFKPDIILYVVGEEQSTSFNGVFEVIEKARLNYIDDAKASLEYISFGLLLDSEGKKLSTRKGTSGKLEDVIMEVQAQAFNEVTQRNPDQPEASRHLTAEKIAIGAIVWNDLRTERRSSVRFDMEKMLQLGSGTVIDIFYTYIRSQAILRQANDSKTEPKFIITDQSEGVLLAALSGFGETISYAAERREPHHLVAYLQRLVQLHGSFYERCRVLGIDDAAVTFTRIALHTAYCTIVRRGLDLLNITPPDYL